MFVTVGRIQKTDKDTNTGCKLDCTGGLVVGIGLLLVSYILHLIIGSK